MLVAYKQLSPGDTPSPSNPEAGGDSQTSSSFSRGFCRLDAQRLERRRRSPLAALPGVGLAGPDSRGPPESALLSSPARQARLVSSRDLALHRYAAGDCRRGHGRGSGQGLGREGTGGPGPVGRRSGGGIGRQERAAGDRLQSPEAGPRQAPRNKRSPSAGCCTRWAISTSRCTRRPLFSPHALRAGRPIRTAMQAATRSAWSTSGICTPFGTPRPTPVPIRRMTPANRSISVTTGPTAGP